MANEDNSKIINMKIGTMNMEVDLSDVSDPAFHILSNSGNFKRWMGARGYDPTIQLTPSETREAYSQFKEDASIDAKIPIDKNNANEKYVSYEEPWITLAKLRNSDPQKHEEVIKIMKADAAERAGFENVKPGLQSNSQIQKSDSQSTLASSINSNAVKSDPQTQKAASSIAQEIQNIRQQSYASQQKTDVSKQQVAGKSFYTAAKQQQYASTGRNKLPSIKAPTPTFTQKLTAKSSSVSGNKIG